MNDVRMLLHDLVDDVPVGPPPIAVMTASGSLRRSRGWWAPLTAAAAVVLVLTGVWALPKAAPAPPASPAPTRSWQELPTPPLSPRWQSLGAYVDGKVVVVGGSSARFSGGPFDVPDLLDGAVFDPATRSWTRMPDAPGGLREWAYTFAVSGDRLIIPLGNRRGWLQFDVGDNAWSRLPAPPQHVDQPTVAADAGHLYVLSAGDAEVQDRVQVLDLSTLAWSSLPASRHLPRLGGRSLVVTDAGLVVMAARPASATGEVVRRPSAVAELWTGHAWVRSAADGLNGHDWYWTGKRIVSTWRVTAREARRDRPDALPAAAFDPLGRTWSALPWLPRRSYPSIGSRRVSAYGDRILAWGYLFDDATGRSSRVPEPSSWSDGAAVLTNRAVIEVGGTRALPGQDPGARVTNLELTNRAWILPLD